MTVGQALFSFRGRMRRRDYWLKGYLVLLPIGILNNILYFGVDNDAARTLSTLISVVTLWPALALLVKRLHDRNRSGWLTATMLIPFAGWVFAIWIVVEVWFLKGTVGPNRFGDDSVVSPSSPPEYSQRGSVIGSAPTQPNISVSPNQQQTEALRVGIQELTQAIQQSPESPSAEQLLRLGTMCALLFDETGDEEDRTRALAAMRRARDLDAARARLASASEQGFGSLMSDPDFADFVRR